MQQHKSNSNQADSLVDSYSNFLRILSTVMYYRLFHLGNFDENTSNLFITDGLGKVDEVPIPIKNLDELNVAFIYHELKISGEKVIS